MAEEYYAFLTGMFTCLAIVFFTGCDFQGPSDLIGIGQTAAGKPWETCMQIWDDAEHGTVVKCVPNEQVLEWLRTK